MGFPAVCIVGFNQQLSTYQSTKTFNEIAFHVMPLDSKPSELNDPFVLFKSLRVIIKEKLNRRYYRSILTKSVFLMSLIAGYHIKKGIQNTDHFSSPFGMTIRFSFLAKTTFWTRVTSNEFFAKVLTFFFYYNLVYSTINMWWRETIVERLS